MLPGKAQRVYRQNNIQKSRSLPPVQLLALELVAGWSRRPARVSGGSGPRCSASHVVDVEYPAVAVDPCLPVCNKPRSRRNVEALRGAFTDGLTGREPLGHSQAGSGSGRALLTSILWAFFSGMDGSLEAGTGTCLKGTGRGTAPAAPGCEEDEAAAEA